MAASDTDNTNNSPASPPVRPSWETLPARPAAAPRPASPMPPSSSPTPYYAAPASAPSAPAAPPAYDPAADPNARYDLAGNPLPSAGPALSAPMPAAPPAPFGYSAGNAPAGVWPPPTGAGGGQPHGAQAYRNNSGEQSHLPPELEKLRWHWGAFFFPILWTKKHGLTTVAAMLTGGLLLLRLLRYVAAAISPTLFLGICVFYGVAYFGLQIFCGLNGHKIGWRNRHFPGGVEEYFKVQNAWMWWGLGINVLLAPALVFGFLALLVGTSLAPHHNFQPYGYGSSYNSYGSSYGNGSNYGNGGSDSNSQVTTH